MTVRSKLRTVAISVGMVLLAWPAPGQINPFRGSGTAPDLSKEDLALLEAAGAKLRSPAATIGSTEEWRNDETGNHGTALLLDITQEDGLPCRKIRHEFVTSKSANRSSYVFNACQLPSGEWKLN